MKKIIFNYDVERKSMTLSQCNILLGNKRVFNLPSVSMRYEEKQPSVIDDTYVSTGMMKIKWIF